MLARALRLSAMASLVCLPLAAVAGPLEDDVKAAYAAWDASFNAAAADKLAAAYAADSTFLPATHDVIKGPDGVEAFFAKLFEMGVTAHKLELIEARARGDMIVAAAKWSATGKDAAGADQPWGGVATHVFSRQPDGSLKLVLHTFN